jgi:hypothetical protein
LIEAQEKIDVQMTMIAMDLENAVGMVGAKEKREMFGLKMKMKMKIKMKIYIGFDINIDKSFYFIKSRLLIN